MSKPIKRDNETEEQFQVRLDNYKASKAKYRQSAKGKAVNARAQAKYRQSDNYKASNAKYAHSDKGKAAHAKYDRSAKGKATHAKAQAKYAQSANGKAVQAKSKAKPESKAYNSVRQSSRLHAHKLIPYESNFEVHHAFGMQRRDYLYLPKWLHDLLHTDFKKPNESRAPNDSCLWTNPAVRFYLVNSGATFYEVHGNDVKAHFPPSLLLTYSK